MFSRDYYESKFRSYADLVILTEMRKMLGGIGDRKAMTLIRSGRIKAFYIDQKYLIPKICIIDYLLSLNNLPEECNHHKKLRDFASPEQDAYVSLTSISGKANSLPSILKVSGLHAASMQKRMTSVRKSFYF